MELSVGSCMSATEKLNYYICHDDKILISYRSWEKVMTGEIIDISRNFCVFWGAETLKTWFFISIKMQMQEISEKKIHIGLDKNWWQIFFGQVTLLAVPISIYGNLLTRNYLDFYIR